MKIAIFPLSNVVLFPDGLAPLHVFEPRYRQMTEDALEGDRTIGMIAVRPDHLSEMGGDPPVYEIGCAGFITEHQRLADGRFHVLLKGTHRFRVESELAREEGRLYRTVEATVEPDEPVEDAQGGTLRDRIIDQLESIARLTAEEGSSALDVSRLGELEPATFANTICQSIGLPAVEKQGLLEADGILARLLGLESVLDFHLAELQGHSVGGSETLQ